MKKHFYIPFILIILGIVFAVILKNTNKPDTAGESNIALQVTQQNKINISLTQQGSVAKTIPRQTVILTNLPDHIQSIAQDYVNEPRWATFKKLTPADKDILLQLYRQETNLVKKGSLTEALGFIGDEEVVEIFKHTLSDQYAGRKLKAGNPDVNEEFVMGATVAGLGFLANKSDSAYDIIQKGIDPKFWKEYCKFTPATGADFYGSLAGESILAIGRSGRSDALKILESLKPLPLVNDLDNTIMRMSFDGAVFDAAFANDIIAQQGMDYYKYLYFNLNASLERMREWQKSGIGLEWDKWYQKRKME
jgi:hypothetical protein